MACYDVYMKMRQSTNILIIASVLLMSFAPGPRAFAQDAGRNDASDAITGRDPLAPARTGLGQVVEPIIQTPATQTPQPGAGEGEAVPYSQPSEPPPERPDQYKGEYYGDDVKTSGQYYEGGARYKGYYSIPETGPEGGSPGTISPETEGALPEAGPAEPEPYRYRRIPPYEVTAPQEGTDTTGPTY